MTVDAKVRHIILECTNPACMMRFPVLLQGEILNHCPQCGSPARHASAPYEEHQVISLARTTGNFVIEALLDNIRSLYNVGSMFRTADGAGISRIHLCGMTPTPHNPRLKKTALGAEKSVPWTYERNGLHAAQRLKGTGMRLWGLEGGERSCPLREASAMRDGPPVILVVGNEISGIDPEIMELCDMVFHIPMKGRKTSLNAAVAFGIAAYALCWG